MSHEIMSPTSESALFWTILLQPMFISHNTGDRIFSETPKLVAQLRELN